MITFPKLSTAATLNQDLPGSMPLSRLPDFSGPFEEVAEVLQGELAVTNSIAQKPILASFGVGQYVGLAGFDAINKTAFMCHIDVAPTVLATGPTLLYHLREATPKKAFTGSVIVFSGLSSAEQETAQQVIRLCQNQRASDMNFELAYQEFGEQGAGISLTLDARNGALNQYNFAGNKLHRTKEPFLTLAQAKIRGGGMALDVAYSVVWERQKSLPVV